MNSKKRRDEKIAEKSSAMPLFIFIGHDGADGPAKRDANRTAHLAYLEGLHADGRLVYGGPIRNEVDCSIGAMLVFSAVDLAAARKIVADDPYVEGGVYADAELRLFIKIFPR